MNVAIDVIDENFRFLPGPIGKTFGIFLIFFQLQRGFGVNTALLCFDIESRIGQNPKNQVQLRMLRFNIYPIRHIFDLQIQVAVL